MKLHGNAALSLNKRRLLCRRVVEDECSLTEAARAAEVSERTASKWVRRFRAEGEAGLLDRSSAPHTVANRTPEERVQAIAALRRLRFTGAQIAELFEMPQTTVSGILTRIGMGRLVRLGREPARRYERRRPGELVHVDVKKLGRIQLPGHRVTGNRTVRARRTRVGNHGRSLGTAGWEFVHVAVDDATRLAYAEVLADERAKTAVGFLRRALAFYRRHGVSVERVMTDNGSAYRRRCTRSPVARSACATCARAPTARRPTARPSASSARCSASGPTERSTARAQSAPRPSTAGCGATTSGASTAPSAAGPRQPGSPS